MDREELRNEFLSKYPEYKEDLKEISNYTLFIEKQLLMSRVINNKYKT